MASTWWPRSRSLTDDWPIRFRHQVFRSCWPENTQIVPPSSAYCTGRVYSVPVRRPRTISSITDPSTRPEKGDRRSQVTNRLPAGSRRASTQGHLPVSPKSGLEWVLQSGAEVLFPPGLLYRSHGSCRGKMFVAIPEGTSGPP
jgi:hypothetical protein